MTARPGFPAVTGAATFQDIRRSLSGQLAKSAAGVLRTGILPITTDRLMVGTASMVVNVQTCVIVHDRNGAVYLPNDGVQTVQLSSAPSSGSRWSIVYSKQRETEAPFSDTTAGPIIDKVESTTSETAARNLLPAGARELGVWKVDAGTTTTNAASGVTYTETVPYTAMEGGVVLLRNQAEMDAWTPHDGALAYRLDLGQFAVRESGVWAYEEAGTFTFAETFYANHPDYEALKLSRRGKRSKLKGALSTNAAVPFNANTVYTVSSTIPTGWRPRTGADAICPIIFSGTSTVWGWARVTSAGLFQIWLSAAANSSAGAGGSVIPIDLEWANAA